MTLEEFLYRSDGFKSSSFHTPLPLPLQMSDPSPDLQLDGSNFRPLLSCIISILLDHSVEEDKTNLAMRMVSKPGYPGGETLVLTLIVEVTQGLEISSSAWSRPRDDLQGIFNSSGYEYVRIEIYDWDRAFMPSLFPLMPDHQAIRPYENKRPRLLDCIRN